MDSLSAGSRSKAALIVIHDCRGLSADAFSATFERTHVAGRLSSQEVLSVNRWLSEDAATGVILYDITEIGALRRCLPNAAVDISSLGDHSWFGARVTMRKDRPHLEGARAMLLLAMNVDPDAENEFNDWYDREHIPALFALSGVLGAIRYRAEEGPRKYLAIYYLVDASVQRSADWAKAIDTPWARTVRPRTRDRVRLVCRRT